MNNLDFFFSKQHDLIHEKKYIDMELYVSPNQFTSPTREASRIIQNANKRGDKLPPWKIPLITRPSPRFPPDDGDYASFHILKSNPMNAHTPTDHFSSYY